MRPSRFARSSGFSAIWDRHWRATVSYTHLAVIVPELGIQVTYDSLRQQVLAMANALASVGIRRGDSVAIALPNGLPAIVSFLAASIAGTAAPLNLAYPYEEFLFFLGDTNARILLCPPVGAEFARSAAADRKIPVFSVEMTEPVSYTHLDVYKRQLLA